MVRQVRKVPKDWQHPIEFVGSMNKIRFVAMYEWKDLSEEMNEWDDEEAKWKRGVRPDYINPEYSKLSYEEYAGRRPDYTYLMPCWSEGEKTHYMMYETCREGCPISPAFETPEELARWLVDNNASVCGSYTASYEEWLAIAGNTL